MLSWMDRGPALCGVARKAERGKHADGVLIPQWQLVNRKWTRHTLQFPAIFASGHKGTVFTQLEPFLAKWTNRSLFGILEISVRGDQRGEGLRVFSQHKNASRDGKSSRLPTRFDHFFRRIRISSRKSQRYVSVGAYDDLESLSLVTFIRNAIPLTFHINRSSNC